MTPAAQKVLDGIVVDYHWEDNGFVTVTLSWAPARRRTVSVPAQEFTETTIRRLREVTAVDVAEGRIK